MSSMNFQAIGQQQTVANQSQQLVLREGQVFHGSIKQLFPNQVAEVQVGSNKLVAKLETPLKAGDSHYFQVTNTKGQVELKVVTGPMAQATAAQQMTQLMDSMNLPKTNEMRQVLTHFIANNIPISKDVLIQAEAWLKSLPDAASRTVALQAMARMVELKMPFTNDVFQALMNGSRATGMSDALSTLMQRITQDAQINSNLKLNIQNQIQTIQQPMQQQIGANVLATAVSTILSNDAPIGNKLESLAILKQANILPQQATISNIISSNTNSNVNQSVISRFLTQFSTSQPSNIGQVVQGLQTVIAQDQTLLQDQKVQLSQQLERFMQLPKTSDNIAQFTKQLGEQLLKFQAENQLNNPSLTNNQGASPKEQLLSLLKVDMTNTQPLTTLAQLASSNNQSPFIQSITTNAEQLVQKNIDSTQIEQAMKTVLRSLGLHYEATLSKNNSDQLNQVAQTLKPQLMNLLADAQVSPPVREAAESLLARINGMQLLSTETGHQHQVVMQVPLDFLGKKMDATLHWNGRMKEDGKIDTDYARILFYLQMEFLNETVIDMQVQNRIISLTVFNENTTLQPITNGLKEILAQGLEDKGYQLSGVHLKTFETEVKEVKEKALSDKPHSGVDIRV